MFYLLLLLKQAVKWLCGKLVDLAFWCARLPVRREYNRNVAAIRLTAKICELQEALARNIAARQAFKPKRRRQSGYIAVEFFVIGVVAALIVAVIIFAVRSENEWQAYAKAHNCQRTGNSNTDYIMQPIVDHNGHLVTMIANPVTTYEYRCDGGQVRWH